MTLDVKIGKCINKEDKQNKQTEDKQKIAVLTCPIADYDVCDPKYTLWPRESFRSGSSDFWNFWEMYVTQIFYKFSENPDISIKDRYISFLKPYIDDINMLSDHINNDVDRDRMKWFKFWANSAVELYEDDACIQFS